MNPGLIAPVILGLVFGLGIGCIPVVNEHLDWRMLKVIPVGGLLIGCAAAFLQFHLCKVMHVCVEGGVGVALALAAGIGFLGTDVGKYYTMTIDVPTSDAGPKVAMKLSSLVDFGKYMEIRLGSSSIPLTRTGRHSVDVGGGFAKLFYLGDIAGTALGAWAVLLMLAGSNPYCRRCTRYKRKGRSLEIAIPDGDEAAKPLLDGLAAGVSKNDYGELAAFLKKAHGEQVAGTMNRKIECTEHCCDACKEGSLAGELKTKNSKGEWSTVDGSAFHLTSPTDAGFLL